METLYRHREWLAAGHALAALALLAALSRAPMLAPPKPPQEPLIQVTLEEVPEPPKPEETAPPPPPPQPAPPQPHPVVQETPPLARPQPVAKPKVERSRPLASSSVHQVEAPAAAAPTEPAPPAPIAPLASAAPPAPLKPAPAPGPIEDGSGHYVAGVRDYLDSIKRYPTSREARLEHPTGIATVWFVLDRQGGLVDLGIEHTSGSMILDQAALSTVRRGEFSPFPSTAWNGESTHRFVVQLRFIVD